MLLVRAGTGRRPRNRQRPWSFGYYYLTSAVPGSNHDLPSPSDNAAPKAVVARFGAAASSLPRRAGKVHSQDRGLFRTARAVECRKRGLPRRAPARVRARARRTAKTSRTTQEVHRPRWSAGGRADRRLMIRARSFRPRRDKSDWPNHHRERSIRQLQTTFAWRCPRGRDNVPR